MKKKKEKQIAKVRDSLPGGSVPSGSMPGENIPFIPSDVLGSYTGVDYFEEDGPVQDADDL